MKRWTGFANVAFAMTFLCLPAAAQSVGGPTKPKIIGGPTVHANPVVAPPRSTVASALASPTVKPVVHPINPSTTAAPAQPRHLVTKPHP